MGKTLINAILILVTCCIIAGCNDGCTDPYIAYNVGSVTKDSETNVSYFNVWGVGVDSFMVENASSGNIELLLNSNSMKQYSVLYFTYRKQRPTMKEKRLLHWLKN